MIAEEIERLVQDEHLFELLKRYAAGNEQNQELWQDRVMTLDGASAEQVRRLHGELLAYEWIEQNTGLATPGVDGGVANCYRLTPDGRTALWQVQTGQTVAAAPVGPELLIRHARIPAQRVVAELAKGKPAHRLPQGTTAPEIGWPSRPV